MAFAIIGGSMAVIGTTAGLIGGAKAKKRARDAQGEANKNFNREM